MRKMSRKQFLRWEKLRLKGRNYVVLRVAVASGILFFILLNFANWLLTGSSLRSTFLLLYAALGLAVGTFIWWLNEQRFEAFLVNKKANARVKR